MPTEAHPPLQSPLTLAQLAREQRLQVIVRKGLPPFRQTALELTKALGGASPDLKTAARLIAADPALSSQVLRLCNSPLLGMHSRVISIDHAITLLGPERLRSLALTSSLADFAGTTLPESQMSAFWQHSFLNAMLSQYLAERWKYFEKYQAYIAGLLHDIGQVPEWMLLGERAGDSEAPPADWVDNPAVEQEHFGTDHCRLGAAMAHSWELMPSFVDVIENHHTPELARRDSILVRIVAAADCFLLSKVQLPPREARSRSFEQSPQRLVQLGEGLFGEVEWPQVEESLEREYTRILPIAEAGLAGLIGGKGDRLEGDLPSDSGATAQPARGADSRLPRSSSPTKAPAGQGPVSHVRSDVAPTSLLSRCMSLMKAFFS